MGETTDADSEKAMRAKQRCGSEKLSSSLIEILREVADCNAEAG